MQWMVTIDRQRTQAMSFSGGLVAASHLLPSITHGGCMKNTLIAVVAFVMATTAAYAQKINVDSDPAAPFATYKTYAWGLLSAVNEGARQDVREVSDSGAGAHPLR